MKPSSESNPSSSRDTVGFNSNREHHDVFSQVSMEKHSSNSRDHDSLVENEEKLIKKTSFFEKFSVFKDLKRFEINFKKSISDQTAKSDSDKIEDANLFKEYLSANGLHFELYKNSKYTPHSPTNDSLRTSKEFYDKELSSCFHTVPKPFFDEIFVLNDKFLEKKQSNSQHRQEELTEYLDLIDINLTNQLKLRFNEFIDVMSNFRKMEQSVQSCLERVRDLRERNKNKFQKILCEKANRIFSLTIIKNSMENYLNQLLKLKSLHESQHNMKRLVNKNDEPSKLVDTYLQSEAMLRETVQKLDICRIYTPEIENSKRIAGDSLKLKYISKALGYFKQCWTYNKHNLNSETSFLEESFMNTTVMMENNDTSICFNPLESNTSSLPWTLVEIRKDPKVEKEISNIYFSYLRLLKEEGALIQDYKSALLTECERIRKDMVRDLVNFHEEQQIDKKERRVSDPEELNARQPGDIHSETSIDTIDTQLKMKFILFVAEILKRVTGFLIEFSISQMRAVSTFVKDLADFELFSILKKFGLENLLSPLITISEKLSSELEEQILSMPMNKMKSSDFRQLNSLMQTMGNYFDKELPEASSVKGVTGKPAGGSELENMIQEIIRKFFIANSGRFRRQTNTEFKRKFIQNFFNQHNSDLKLALENEVWVPVDIPYDFLAALLYIFNFVEKKSVLEQERANMKSIQEENSFLEDLEDGEEETKENSTHYKIPVDKYPCRLQQNSVILNERKYLVTNSFLLLLKLCYDCLNFAEDVKELGEEIILSLLESLKFYNEYMQNLLLEADAVKFEKIKIITGRILALESTLLTFLKEIVLAINVRIGKILREKPESLTFANNKTLDITKQIMTHKDSVLKQLKLILSDKLVENCLAQSALEWGNEKAKINIPTKYTAKILNNMRSMFSNTDDLLDPDALGDLFADNIERWQASLKETFSHIKLDNEKCGKRVKEEFEYIVGCLWESPVSKYIHDSIKTIERELMDLASLLMKGE